MRFDTRGKIMEQEEFDRVMDEAWERLDLRKVIYRIAHSFGACEYSPSWKMFCAPTSGPSDKVNVWREDAQKLLERKGVPLLPLTYPPELLNWQPCPADDNHPHRRMRMKIETASSLRQFKSATYNGRELSLRSFKADRIAADCNWTVECRIWSYDGCHVPPIYDTNAVLVLEYESIKFTFSGKCEVISFADGVEDLQSRTILVTGEMVYEQPDCEDQL